MLHWVPHYQCGLLQQKESQFWAVKPSSVHGSHTNSNLSSLFVFLLTQNRILFHAIQFFESMRSPDFGKIRYRLTFLIDSKHVGAVQVANLILLAPVNARKKLFLIAFTCYCYLVIFNSKSHNCTKKICMMAKFASSSEPNDLSDAETITCLLVHTAHIMLVCVLSVLVGKTHLDTNF